MVMFSPDQLCLSVFFTSKQSLDSTQVYPLVRKARYFPAKKKVFFIVNPGTVTADPGDLQQAKAFPVTEGLLMNTKLCGNFFDRQDHGSFFRRG